MIIMPIIGAAADGFVGTENERRHDDDADDGHRRRQPPGGPGVMKRPCNKESRGEWPAIVPGDWLGEIAGSCSLNVGQAVQDGPPRQSVEFTYLIMPALLTMPESRFTWPGVIMIMAPTPLKPEQDDAGTLFKASGLPSLTLGLDVTRAQFSDLIPLLDAKRLTHFLFMLEAERRGAWPVRSWGMGTRFS